MMSKILTFALFSLLFIQISGSTIEDAKQALQDLDDFSLTKQGELHSFMINQSSIFHTQLEEMLLSTQKDITSQINTIFHKMTDLFENTIKTGADVSLCNITSINSLTLFAKSLNDTLGDCYGNMIVTENSMLYSSWSRVWDEYDFSYNCNKMSLSQCEKYEDEKCIDAVISNIERKKSQMSITFELFKTEMENKIIGMNFPCRGMVLEKLAMYSSLNLEYVKVCLDSLLDDFISYKLGC